MYQEEFDLKSHWCNFNGLENTTHPVSESSEYYDLDAIQSGSVTTPNNILHTAYTLISSLTLPNSMN